VQGFQWAAAAPALRHQPDSSAQFARAPVVQQVAEQPVQALASAQQVALAPVESAQCSSRLSL